MSLFKDVIELLMPHTPSGCSSRQDNEHHHDHAHAQALCPGPSHLCEARLKPALLLQQMSWEVAPAAAVLEACPLHSPHSTNSNVHFYTIMKHA